MQSNGWDGETLQWTAIDAQGREVQQDPAMDSTLDRIFRSYSMSREREVHRAIVGAGDAPPSEEKTSDNDEDLFATALF